MTARAQPNEVRALLELGADQVITKPFEPLSLGARIQEFVTNRARRAEQDRAKGPAAL